MNCTIRWKDCNKSDAVTNYIEEKVSKFYDFNFVQEDIKVEVVNYPKEKTYKIRINVSVPTKGVIRSEANDFNILTAVNKACDKIIDQLRRVKTQFKINQ